jgi:hypothetical protein
MIQPASAGISKEGLIVAVYPGYKKKQTDVFVCDSCGSRKRLARDKRHWCDDCNRGTPVEMRRARDKRLVQR